MIYILHFSGGGEWDFWQEDLVLEADSIKEVEKALERGYCYDNCGMKHEINEEDLEFTCTVDEWIKNNKHYV